MIRDWPTGHCPKLLDTQAMWNCFTVCDHIKHGQQPEPRSVGSGYETARREALEA